MDEPALFSLEDKTVFPREKRFRFAFRRSNWMAILPTQSCGGCHEVIHEALSTSELTARGIQKVTNLVLADSLLVSGEFNVDELKEAWDFMKQPKKIILLGDCTAKTVNDLGWNFDLTLKGCPLDLEELKAILTL
ncbi:MAG: hypothetical protein ACXAEU_00940 [Candidatus Hodarchaeales archaeon]